MTEKIYITALCVIAIALAILATLYVVRFVLSCRKSARMEGKMIADSKRLIWRIVNTGTRDITIVEIGIKCADRYASYRPLYAANEDINNIPHRLGRGDIASYRKEMERFAFRQSETDALKVSNPYIYFYAKDAEGTEYCYKSEYKFAQYLTVLIGGGK